MRSRSLALSALFALMLLRVPVGMAMGLVGVSGFAYIVGGTAALKNVGLTSMRTVTDYTFGVIPMFLLMGAFVSNSGMSRELFRAAERLRRTFQWWARHCHYCGLRGLCGDLGLFGRHRRDLRHRRLSGNAPIQLPAIVRHWRDRRRRHAWRDAAAFDGAGGLRHHHRAGHRQAVYRRHHSGPASPRRWTCSPLSSSARCGRISCRRAAPHLGRTPRRTARHLGDAAAFLSLSSVVSMVACSRRPKRAA